MKKFFNGKTALAGVLTALLLTGISIFAYFTYCDYLENRPGSIAVTMSATIDEGTAGIDEGTMVLSSAEDASRSNFYAVPSASDIRELYGYFFVLYKELCNNQRVREGKEPYLHYEDFLFGAKTTPEIPSAFDEKMREELIGQYESITTQTRANVEYYLQSLEDSFSEFNQYYDYWLVDLEHPERTLTNTQTLDLSAINPTEYTYLFQIDYDEHGVPSIGERNFYCGDGESLYKILNSVMHEKTWQVLSGGISLEGVEYGFLRDAIERTCKVTNPASCSMVVGISAYKYQMMHGFTFVDDEIQVASELFASLSVKAFCLAILCIACFSGLFYLNSRSAEKRSVRLLARAPFEFVLALIALIYSAKIPLRNWMTGLYLQYDMDYVSAGLYVFFLCIVAWYVGGCLGEIRIIGFREYFSKRLFLLIIGRALQHHAKKLIEEYRRLNLGMDLRRKIFRLVFINMLIITAIFIVTFVFEAAILGFIGIFLYSFTLFLLVLRYIAAVQRDYRGLQRMTMEMSEGNLKYEPEDSLGLFEPVKEDLVQIRNGFDKAVQDEVKSQKMKAELITNVSHDLKTPLTAIITYVNLLKEKNLTPEQIQSYVNTLDQKSLRLKRLIEDLFEVSKANSGNIQLNLQNCDLANLIKQCYFEVQDKLEEKGLTTRLTFPEEKVILRLDSEKTYRIYENLFNNIAKYAMTGTRVYVAMEEDEDNVTVTIKNITEAELYVPAQELTERFVRGDASRGSVEGSGLGLAIVRSFTEIQGGRLTLDIDGDLFKVTTTWRKPIDA
ncbi:MAG: HAMP domain-containing histidine kinase [Lachnospiraceae bacterium]|nr:HAMP domain-containing histidine kinase [Lachnospiraceae bacterium]